MNKIKFPFLLLLITFITVSAFKVNTRNWFPKKGENLLAYYSQNTLAQAHEDAVKDKAVNEKLNACIQELNKISKTTLCYGIYSDDATLCKKKGNAQENHVSYLANKRKPCTRYGIIYDCNSFDIYMIVQIGY
jgi:hypothetical protein